MPAVAPIDGAAADAVAQAALFHTETAQRQERLEAVNDNRNEQIKRLFIRNARLVEIKITATTIQVLCNLTKKQITVREIRRADDCPGDGFNEVNYKAPENLISALTKLLRIIIDLVKRVSYYIKLTYFRLVDSSAGLYFVWLYLTIKLA